MPRRGRKGTRRKKPQIPRVVKKLLKHLKTKKTRMRSRKQNLPRNSSSYRARIAARRMLNLSRQGKIYVKVDCVNKLLKWEEYFVYIIFRSGQFANRCNKVTPAIDTINIYSFQRKPPSVKFIALHITKNCLKLIIAISTYSIFKSSLFRSCLNVHNLN